jgi:hypothetical protein
VELLTRCKQAVKAQLVKNHAVDAVGGRDSEGFGDMATDGVGRRRVYAKPHRQI